MDGVIRERPAGTVTFLFTDIEGSTALWEDDPTGMRVALEAHDACLRRAIERHDGWWFKHTGDGVCAAFDAPADAVAAAVEAQRDLALPVRMGIATGVIEHRGDDYVGAVLNRTTRVMAAGHGGQIVMAASTAGLVEGVALVDLGDHRLRGLAGTHRLFQVRASGLREDFPRLRTGAVAPGNVPQAATRLVGREREVTEIVDLLRAHRLVTLTGVGGVGKTRLAVEVASTASADLPDGGWLVELAAVGDGFDVPDAVELFWG